MEHSDIIHLGQGPNVDISHTLVHEAFSRIAVQNPAAVAVEHDEEQITYGELDHAATTLSRRLLGMGLRPGDRVVLLVQRSIPMIVAIFAVLKSGCQYVPLDGGVVADITLEHIISDIEPPLILCLERYSKRAHQFALSSTHILSLEDSWASLADVDVERGLGVAVDPDAGAYVIYTSGSLNTY